MTEISDIEKLSKTLKNAKKLTKLELIIGFEK